MKKSLFFRLIVASSVAVFAACGGGDDASPEQSTAPARSWTIGSHFYEDAGFSSLQRQTFGATTYTTVTAMARSDANSPYSGSLLTFVFSGDGGTYSVYPDFASLQAAPPGSKGIVVESTVGVWSNTGSTVYRAKSGQVEITKDSAGMFHFSTSQALPTVKASDIEGGVDGAPDEMLLSMNDVV